MRNKIESIIPDAIIVLANHMDANGVLNLESIARAKKAVEIFNEKNIPYLVTSGWAYRKDSEIKIAVAFKHYLVENLHVNPKKILTELNSRDTVGDAFFTKINLAVPLSWKKICVVTSNYHVERANEIFNLIYGNKFLINTYGADVIHDDSVVNNELSSINIFRKTFLGVEIGNDNQILSRLQEAHPFYNGRFYDKIYI